MADAPLGCEATEGKRGSRSDMCVGCATEQYRSGSGPLRVLNIIFNKENYISFPFPHATAPSFFRLAHLLHLCPKFPKRLTKMRAGRKGGFRGEFRLALHLVFFLLLFRTIFSFLRNCADFWIKFELFSRKIRNYNCVFAPLDALRGRTEAWGFGGKDSVRPHYLFLASFGTIL